jgi:AraC family transcriptional regulator of adaptative response/methylated-DNA-[protein]-cysteine methyltransferase
VAATERGLCSIQFGDSDAELRDALVEEFGAAVVIEDAPGTAERAIVAHLAGQPMSQSLPLDIQATAFQRRVWEHLQTIPYGQTQSYGEVAPRIGQPTASRAVARACATNPVAIAIPCHRVVRNSGELDGKRVLLGKERLDEERG